MCRCVHVCRYPRKSEVAQTPPAPMLQAVVSCLKWVLEKQTWIILGDQYIFFTTETTSAPPLFSLYLWVCVYVCVSSCHMYTVAQDCRKRASDPWELQ